MKRNELTRAAKIDRSCLSGGRYTESLLEAATAAGLLNEEDQRRIGQGFLSLLAREAERFNNGAGSSLPVEIAGQLLDSILFTVGMALKALPSPEDAAEALGRESMTDLFAAGLRQIYAKRTSTKAIHGRLVKDLLETPNVFYRPSAVDAIRGFFKVYNPEFDARAIHITADYPVSRDPGDLAGIEFIRAYVGALYYENAFCRYFPKEDIHDLLLGFNRDYANIPLNLYEPVLAAALGTILAGANRPSLRLTSTHLTVLEQTFQGKRAASSLPLLDAALDRLAGALALPGDVAAYLRGSLPKLAKTISLGAGSNALAKVFPLPARAEAGPRLTFAYGTKMDDGRYRQIVDEIGLCSTIADKMDVIRESVHSLADLEDLLLDAAWTKEEMDAVLGLLAPVELAALLKHWAGPEANGTGANEQRLCLVLKTHTAKLPQAQQQWLFKTVKHIEDEHNQ